MRAGADQNFEFESAGETPEVLSSEETIDGKIVGFDAVGEEPKTIEEELQEYFKLRAEAVLKAQEQALKDYRATGEGLSPEEARRIQTDLIVNKGMKAWEKRKKFYRGERAA